MGKENTKNEFSLNVEKNSKVKSEKKWAVFFSLRSFIIIFSLLFLIFLDLFTKFIAKNFLDIQINIIKDLFFLEFVKNPWIAFSIIIPSLFLKITTIILIFGIVYYYIKEEQKKENKLIDLSFILILSWALGNAYERVFIGEVVDFIGVKYFSIFNFADIYISLWIILYLYKILLWHKKIHLDQEK
jgi:signal peptidase II